MIDISYTLKDDPSVEATRVRGEHVTPDGERLFAERLADNLSVRTSRVNLIEERKREIRELIEGQVAAQRAQASFDRGFAGNPPQSERDELRHNAGREMAADGDYSMVTVTSQTELYRLKAVKALDDLQSGDGVAAHVKADCALLKFLRETGNTDVADAYASACQRIGFDYWPKS